jgi:predicted HicB family RNase H-like nuclease
MNVDGFVQAVIEDLGRTAAIGDEATARAAMLLTGALDSSLRRRLQEALSEAALELSGQIAPARVDLRVAGADLILVPVDVAEDVAPTGGGADEVFSARITLRLPESLKARLESAAVAAGVSVNTFVVQSLGRASEPRPTNHSGGRRLTGYGRS